MKGSRLANRDLKKLQRNHQEKAEKQLQGMIELLGQPDYDVSEFFQTLMRTGNHEQILSRIPREKQIDFLARNYVTFIETQDEIAQLKLPELDQIPKTKVFKFEEAQEAQQAEDTDQSSVMEIIDSFGAVVLEKNTSDVVRILDIIREMKEHSRYRKYFNVFSINQMFRESYETFLQACDDRQVLLRIGEVTLAMRKYLREKMGEFIVKIRTDINIDSSPKGVKKIMQRVSTFIDTTLRECKQEFPADKIPNPMESDILIPRFLSEMSKQFYQTLQPCIYEKEELGEILQCLEAFLESASELESKGVNLSSYFRALVAHDLPLHMNRILEVVIEAFEDILKEDDSLYEFRYFDALSTLGVEMQMLSPIREGEYGRKCCSKKGILLINAFVIILEPLCDQKWLFLQDSVLQQLLNKVSGAIYDSNWHYWDYYQLFCFFERLKSGKVKHKKLFKEDECPASLRERISAAQKIGLQCWQNFENKLTSKFWTSILVHIPKNLWEMKQYYEKSGETNQKPTVFSMELAFSVENFLKNIQFRLQKQQFEFTLARLYEYIMYMIEYVIYYEYHSKGTKEKVFSLFQKSEKIFRKTKNLEVEGLQIFREQKRILKIGYFSKTGVKNMAIDIFYFTEAFKIMSEYDKVSAQQFVIKIAQIEAKEHKTDPTSVTKQEFAKTIETCIKVYKDEPEKIRQYIDKKRKELSSKSKQP